MIVDGWITTARKFNSPHFNQRPNIEDISLLVVHNISLPPAQFGNQFVEEFFCGELDHKQHPYFEQLIDLRVSSHLYIKRKGELVQFVPFQHRAWHAGASHFKHRENCNDFSIGIELEGTDHEVFTDKQYATLAQATKTIMQTYPKISRDRIVGHSDIAPGRKTDPGECFDWHRYLSELETS